MRSPINGSPTAGSIRVDHRNADLHGIPADSCMRIREAVNTCARQRPSLSCTSMKVGMGHGRLIPPHSKCLPINRFPKQQQGDGWLDLFHWNGLEEPVFLPDLHGQFQSWFAVFSGKLIARRHRRGLHGGGRLLLRGRQVSHGQLASHVQCGSLLEHSRGRRSRRHRGTDQRLSVAQCFSQPSPPCPSRSPSTMLAPATMLKCALTDWGGL